MKRRGRGGKWRLSDRISTEEMKKVMAKKNTGNVLEHDDIPVSRFTRVSGLRV